MKEKLQRLWRKRIYETALDVRWNRAISDNNSIIIEGLTPSSAGLIACALSEQQEKPVVIISSLEETTEEVYDSIRYFGGDERAYHFCRWGTLPFDQEEPPLEVRAKHSEALYALLARSMGEQFELPLIAATITSLCHKIFAPDYYIDLIYPIKVKTTIQNESLTKRLMRGGYERRDIVESRGEFAIRGGIIDIYPPNFERAIRLDLFGDEVDSIRYFDVYTQRSLYDKPPLEDVVILPAKEKFLIDSAHDSGQLSSLVQWLPQDTLILLYDGENFKKAMVEYWHQIEQRFGECVAHKRLAPDTHPDTLFMRSDDIEHEIERFTSFRHYPLSIERREKGTALNLNSRSFDGMPATIEAYIHFLRERHREGFIINICCDNEGQAWRLEEILLENGLTAIAEPPHPQKIKDPFYQQFRNESLQDIITITVGDLHAGFIIHTTGIIFVTDREIFGRYKKRHIFRKFYKGVPVTGADEMKRGDYVVHVDHGIGRFKGIRQQYIDEKHIDFLEIEYLDRDRLLVPVDKIHYIEKYSGVEGLVPTLDRLGSKRWVARKKKTQESIERMAKELLEIYAWRSMAEGYSFSPDTVWQTEFEATFPYEETPDQRQSIMDVKQDLEGLKPMDRLVCGDVGYGKTEVAIRAAYKVIQEGKQVALLTPTTILAQQHFRTFKERFGGFPVTVDMLSRFRSPKEQRDIIHRLKYGETNIIIGTHRLLSEDVQFSELGLVIVDEEQRFGVRHKEKLKKMRASIDFITLTATPIPRTLHMALSGLRDMSLINTPPPGRLPIKTKIIHFEPELIREAILRELNRGGQIYFVHNRIHNIQQVAEKIQEIIPNLRIATAHGRMNERELEKVMIDFVNQKHDMLLSTTIIENGLDIPNVNTIIINRADAMGLAQLYQLRGRIGRDIRQAYAYLIVPKGEPITEAAVMRLAAIEEFTELGSGFNIAMRDLEIRGAGNLLGKEQHGCIVNIGFDLYCQLLEETIRRLKGEEVISCGRPIEIKLDVEVFLPPQYIPTESMRIGVYKRLAQTQSLEGIDEIGAELRDRYGIVAEPVVNLLRASRLRVLASMLGIRTIIQKQTTFRIITSGDDAGQLSLELEETAGCLRSRVLFIRIDDSRFEVTVKNGGKKPSLEISIETLIELLTRAIEKNKETGRRNQQISKNSLPG